MCVCVCVSVCLCVCVYVCVNVYELLHEVHVLLQRRSGMHVVHVVRGRGEPGPTLPSSAYQYTLSAHISLPPHSHLLQFCFPLLHGFGCASSFFALSSYSLLRRSTMSHIIVHWRFVVRGYNWATLGIDLPQSAFTWKAKFPSTIYQER